MEIQRYLTDVADIYHLDILLLRHQSGSFSSLEAGIKVATRS